MAISAERNLPSLLNYFNAASSARDVSLDVSHANANHPAVSTSLTYIRRSLSIFNIITVTTMPASHRSISHLIAILIFNCDMRAHVLGVLGVLALLINTSISLCKQIPKSLLPSRNFPKINRTTKGSRFPIRGSIHTYTRIHTHTHTEWHTCAHIAAEFSAGLIRRPSFLSVLISADGGP